MDTTEQLIKVVESALEEVAAYIEVAVIHYGDIDEQTPKAQEALKILKRRIENLEAFFYYMLDHQYAMKEIQRLQTTAMGDRSFYDQLEKFKKIVDEIQGGES